MPLDLLQGLAFGLACFFILLGIVGTIIPILPGMLLVWVTVLVYTLAERANGYAAIDPTTFVVITIIALVTGLADLWLPLLGARISRTSKRAMALGLIGGIIGTFITPLIGTLIGYALGILIGEFHKVRDLRLALRASVNGLAHWGIGTAIQLGGSIVIFIIFVWQVLSFG